MQSLNTILPGQSSNEIENNSAFEQMYQKVREKEKRNYTDEEVANLPDIAPHHPFHKEWQLRAFSCNKQIEYLKNMNRPLEILEVGCGNGWLSAKLADMLQASVTGIDINSPELEQAKKVFGKKENLNFLLCDIQSELLQDKLFDVIVFAASIQYFTLLKKIIENAQQHLRLNGEILIIDSNFYKRTELEAAKQRTRNYYDSLGFPEMSKYYFHHCIDDLKIFNYEVLYNPDSILNKLLRNKNPFYLIKILSS